MGALLLAGRPQISLARYEVRFFLRDSGALTVSREMPWQEYKAVGNCV